MRGVRRVVAAAFVVAFVSFFAAPTEGATWTKQLDQLTTYTEKYSGTGFSFDAGKTIGSSSGCLKKCGVKEFGGFSYGAHDYWVKPVPKKVGGGAPCSNGALDGGDGLSLVDCESTAAPKPSATTPAPRFRDGLDGLNLKGRPVPEKEGYVRYGPWSSIQKKWDGMCVYTGDQGEGAASCNLPISSHTWRYANQTGSNKFICGRVLNGSWFEADLGAKNGVGRHHYKFEIRDWTEDPKRSYIHKFKHNPSYADTMLKYCGMLGFKPVCDHPKYCKKDPHALYLGQDKHISFPSDRDSPDLMPKGFVGHIENQWDNLCVYTGHADPTWEHGVSSKKINGTWATPWWNFSPATLHQTTSTMGSSFPAKDTVAVNYGAHYVETVEEFNRRDADVDIQIDMLQADAAADCGVISLFPNTNERHSGYSAGIGWKDMHGKADNYGSSRGGYFGAGVDNNTVHADKITELGPLKWEHGASEYVGGQQPWHGLSDRSLKATKSSIWSQVATDRVKVLANGKARAKQGTDYVETREMFTRPVDFTVDVKQNNVYDPQCGLVSLFPQSSTNAGYFAGINFCEGGSDAGCGTSYGADQFHAGIHGDGKNHTHGKNKMGKPHWAGVSTHATGRGPYRAMSRSTMKTIHRGVSYPRSGQVKVMESGHGYAETKEVFHRPIDMQVEIMQDHDDSPDCGMVSLFPQSKSDGGYTAEINTGVKGDLFRAGLSGSKKILGKNKMNPKWWSSGISQNTTGRKPYDLMNRHTMTANHGGVSYPASGTVKVKESGHGYAETKEVFHRPLDMQIDVRQDHDDDPQCGMVSLFPQGDNAGYYAGINFGRKGDEFSAGLAGKDHPTSYGLFGGNKYGKNKMDSPHWVHGTSTNATGRKPYKVMSDATMSKSDGHSDFVATDTIHVDGGSHYVETKEVFQRPLDMQVEVLADDTEHPECSVVSLFPTSTARHSGYNAGINWWSSPHASHATAKFGGGVDRSLHHYGSAHPYWQRWDKQKIGSDTFDSPTGGTSFGVGADTFAPTGAPTGAPFTYAPTNRPSDSPSPAPTHRPTPVPTYAPTSAGINCARGGYPNTAVWMHSGHVDAGHSGEAPHIKNTVSSIPGAKITKITSIPGSWSPYDVVVFPEMERGAVSFSSSQKQALKKWVMGGGKLVFSSDHGGRGVKFLNSMFGKSYGAIRNYASDTHPTAQGKNWFAGAPTKLPYANAVWALSSSSVPGNEQMYTGGSRTSVAMFKAGMGRVYFFAFDWYAWKGKNSACNRNQCTPWEALLRHTLKSDGCKGGGGKCDGVANCQETSAYWDHGSCGHHGDDYQWDWCGRHAGKCKSVVTVSPSICGSGQARFVRKEKGSCYIYYAQYACTGDLEPIKYIGSLSNPAAHPYVYTSRNSATRACQSIGYPGLCTKAQATGFEKCAAGWFSDYRGYWYSRTRSGCGSGRGWRGWGGHKVGAYCCLGSYKQGYRKKYSKKWPHCENYAGKCMTGTRAAFEAACNKYTGCTGYSFPAGASHGGGCLKRCGSSEFGGYGYDSHDYWIKPGHSRRLLSIEDEENEVLSEDQGVVTTMLATHSYYKKYHGKWPHCTPDAKHKCFSAKPIKHFEDYCTKDKECTGFSFVGKAGSGCTKLSTLKENNFNNRGDVSLNKARTYTYKSSCGYTIKLSGWTHTRRYAKGFLRNTAGTGKAVVEGLVPKKSYNWKIYQYASHPYDTIQLNPYSVNGKVGHSTSKASDAATASGTIAADAHGKVTFIFPRQTHHVHLSGIAIAEASSSGAVGSGCVKHCIKHAASDQCGKEWKFVAATQSGNTHGHNQHHFGPKSAIDGKSSTRNGIAGSWTGDLGAVRALRKLTVQWEACQCRNSNSVIVEVSLDKKTWTKFSAFGGWHQWGGRQTHSVTGSAKARYIRLRGTSRMANQWQSYWSVQAFGCIGSHPGEFGGYGSNDKYSYYAKVTPPHMPISKFAISDGNRVTGGKDTWSSYSKCPSGYIAISPQHIDLHAYGSNSNVNHFECTMTGCRMWIRGGTATLITRCLKISPSAVVDSAAITAPRDTWSSYATCPSGFAAAGPSLIDLHSYGSNSNVNHYECTHSGCRVWIRGGHATVKTRCIKGVELVDGPYIRTVKDNWSHYSTCPSGSKALGLRHIDLHTYGANGNVNHQECTNTGCRIWTRGGTATIGTRCIVEKQIPTSYQVHVEKHCGGVNIPKLEDGTPYGWAPGHEGVQGCKERCGSSPSCTAFVWRSTDSKCFWKKNTNVGTLNNYKSYAHTCFMKGSTAAPTEFPTQKPTAVPTEHPTTRPPSPSPSHTPTEHPSPSPTEQPTEIPSPSPTEVPTTRPPSPSPSHTPTEHPTKQPTHAPTEHPTANPTQLPTQAPTRRVCGKEWKFVAATQSGNTHGHNQHHFGPKSAIDGKSSTRNGIAGSWTGDLGAVRALRKLTVQWEACQCRNSNSVIVEVSLDKKTWTKFSAFGGWHQWGGRQTHSVTGSENARYIRLRGTSRMANQWQSYWSVQAFGCTGSDPDNIRTNAGAHYVETKEIFQRPIEFEVKMLSDDTEHPECGMVSLFPQNSNRHTGYNAGINWHGVNSFYGGVDGHGRGMGTAKAFWKSWKAQPINSKTFNQVTGGTEFVSNTGGAVEIRAGGHYVETKETFKRPIEFEVDLLQTQADHQECGVVALFPHNSNRHSGYNAGTGWWGTKSVVVTVGNSGSRSKSVNVPDGYTCPTLVSRGTVGTKWHGSDTYPDVFRIHRSGNRLTAIRMDAHHGWGMQLRFVCRGGGTFGAGVDGSIRAYGEVNSKKWNRIRINAAANGHVYYYVNGVHKYTVADNRYRSGKIRFGNNCRAFRYKNFRVLRSHPSKEWQTVKINAAADGKIYYYLNGQHKGTITNNAYSSGKIRLGHGCLGFQYKDFKVLRSHPSMKWQTVRINAAADGKVHFYLNGAHKGSITNSAYQQGKIRLGNNCRGTKYKNLKILRYRPNSDWQTLRINAAEDGKVHFYLNGHLKHSMSHSAYVKGKIRLGQNCRNFQYRNLRILRNKAYSSWQTVRISAKEGGRVDFYLNGHLKHSMTHNAYKAGKIRLGQNCRNFRYKNLRIFRQRAYAHWQQIRIRATEDGRVNYYLDGKLRHTEKDHSLRKGKIRLGNNCRDFQYKNLRVLRQYPTTDWQTVRIRAVKNGPVMYYLNGKLQHTVHDNKYQSGKLRLGHGCRAWRYRNLRVLRNHFNQSLCNVPPISLHGETSSAHLWRRPWEGPQKFVCGKVDDEMFDAKLKSYNKVPSRQYEFEVVTAGAQPNIPHHHKGWDMRRNPNGKYSDIMKADCRVYGMRPVCDHPRFCANDLKSLYLGNDMHLSYPGHELVSKEGDDGTRLTGFTRHNTKANLNAFRTKIALGGGTEAPTFAKVITRQASGAVKGDEDEDKSDKDGDGEDKDGDDDED